MKRAGAGLRPAPTTPQHMKGSMVGAGLRPARRYPHVTGDVHTSTAPANRHPGQSLREAVTFTFVTP
jgi:hypothetical protein